MLIENELDAYISGFSLNALSSSVSLNVDLDTTLTVVAGNLYRLFARNLPRYSRATPDTLWRHFLDASGALHITPDDVTVDLTLRSHHPVLIDAGFADLETPIPWWDDRKLRFRFPPPLTSASDTARWKAARRRVARLKTSTEFLHRESRLTGKARRYIPLGTCRPLPPAVPPA